MSKKRGVILGDRIPALTRRLMSCEEFFFWHRKLSDAQEPRLWLEFCPARIPESLRCSFARPSYRNRMSHVVCARSACSLETLLSRGSVYCMCRTEVAVGCRRVAGGHGSSARRYWSCSIDTEVLKPTQLYYDVDVTDTFAFRLSRTDPLLELLVDQCSHTLVFPGEYVAAERVAERGRLLAEGK